MNKLKPCHCGGEVEVSKDYICGFYVVQCEKCLKRTHFCATKEQAIKAWNRRVDDESKHK